MPFAALPLNVLPIDELDATELDDGITELELWGAELDESTAELELRGTELGTIDELDSIELELRGAELGAVELDDKGAALLWLLFDDELLGSPTQADKLAASKLIVTIFFIVVPHMGTMIVNFLLSP